MTELASPAQLRMSFLRRAFVTVPVILFLGFLPGRASQSGFGNPWFDALVKSPLMPPGWLFGVAWSILYVMLGVALAMVLDARGNRHRRAAVVLFGVAFVLNLGWSPLFFAMHQVLAAFVLIVFMFIFAVAATVAFGRVRTAAAWWMVPYLAWLCFAAVLNWQTHVLNPNAETLAPRGSSTQIEL